MELKQPNRKQLMAFVVGLTLLLCWFAIKAFRAGNVPALIILAAATFLFIIIYFVKRESVIKFYHIWMRCASAIGMIITGILMLLVFFLVFSPVGLMLRLLRKDILHLKRDPNAMTYWIDRPQKTFNKDDYERQF